MHITNFVSRVFGVFAKQEFYRIIQSPINILYVKILKLDMSEFEKPSYYKSLNDLFSRELKVPREIDQSEDKFISPTDSLITSCGDLNNNTLLQIKGFEYSVDELLTKYVSKQSFEKLENGNYMNFYLSPKDYHRYHSPIDCKILKLIHIPGKLYPVNLKYLNKKVNLFVENERVILECQTLDDKLFYMVFVGALNVGQMVFNFESIVETNDNIDKSNMIEYDDLIVKKGECLGYFKMGSTVVMVWEKNSVKLENLTNQKVQFGTIVANKI